MSTLFINVESEDLIQLFDNPAVKKSIEQIFESILDKKLKQFEAQEEILDFNNTLELLGIKEATLYNWTSSGKIPHYKQGKLFFLKSELLEWLKSGRVKTKWELDEEAEKFINSKRKKAK